MTSGGNNWFLPAAAFTLVGCAAPATDVPHQESKHIESAKPAVAPRHSGISSISLEDFFQLHQSGKVLVFDARPSFIYRFGHVPGAINLPKSRCPTAIAEREDEIRGALAGGKTIVVYCAGTTCPDARAVAMQLSAAGHPSTVFSGGWDAWQEAGLPVE